MRLLRRFWDKGQNNGGRKGFRSKPRQAGKFNLEPLEPRLLLSADLTYTVAAGAGNADLTLRMNGADTLQIVDNTNGSVLASQALAGTTGVVINGGAGNDKLTVDLSNPFSTQVTFAGSSGTDSLIVTGGSSRQWNVTGANTGTAGNVAFSGVENLTGGAGADSFKLGSAGSVSGSVDGGTGVDTLDYSTRTTGVTVNLSLGTATSTGGISNFENITGSSAADTLIGDANANVLIGGAGNDMYALSPGDLDTIVEAAGGGTDTLNYSAFTSPVTVNLAEGTATGLISGFANIENVVGGSGNDTLIGNDSANTLSGGAGDDILDGGAGNDTITGGAGNDTITGGAGNDTLTGGTGDDVYIFDTDTALGSDTIKEYSGGGTDALDFSSTTSESITIDLSSTASQTVNGNLTIRLSSGEVIENAVGGTLNDTITGNTLNNVLTGGPGNDTLTGGAGNDTYVLDPSGTDTIVEVAGGGTDTLDYSAFTTPVTFNLVDRSVTGVNGLNNVEYLTGIRKLVINGTILADNIIVEDIGTSDDGYMQIRWGSSNSIAFTAPTESLKIEAKGGADTIEVKGLDSKFSADLLLYGYESGAPEIMADPSVDMVRFSGNALTHGGAIEAFADKIYVNDNVTISTLDSAGVGEDIVLRARRISATDLTNLLPTMVSLREAVVDIGDNAKLLGGGIYVFAQAEDRDLTEFWGTNRLVNRLAIQPLIDMVSGLAEMPVKLLYKQSDATITVGQGAQIVGSGTVGLYATAAADASGGAKSYYFSAGYGDARATAGVDIATGALIQSKFGSVAVTSNANATAKVKAETKQENKDAALAGSIAVTNAISKSTVTLAAGATVDAHKTANLKAAGNSTSEAEAEGSTSATGTAGLGFAISLSDSDIKTKVDGTVIAHAEGDFLVKIEIDPLAVLNTDQKVSGLKKGDKVELLTGVTNGTGTTIFAAGTLLEYIGHDQTGDVDLSTSKQHYLDPSLWVKTTPSEHDIGYVDYVNNRIYIGGSGLVTEDVINYDSRRGTPIGGLIDDDDYVVIALRDDPTTTDIDESQYIQLALTEQNAIDGIAVDLWYSNTTGVQVTMNAKEFAASDVDTNLSRITLDNRAWNESANKVDWQLFGLTFELGQAVVYHEGTDSHGNKVHIDGLEDGHTYYVITGIDEFDLQGDNRFIQKQVIQLAETEMEARAGVNISLGLDEADVLATGFTLEAKHVLDSGLSNGIGVLATLDAEDKASATAGVEDAGTGFSAADYTFTDKTIFDRVVSGLMSKNSAGTNAAQAGASSAGVQGSPVTAAGAFAFSYADHHVTAEVGGTAVLKSNEDLEVKAMIDHTVQLSAEANTGLPAAGGSSGGSGGSSGSSGGSGGSGSSGGSGGSSGGSGGSDVGISVAADLGLFTTDAEAIVHGGAQLDALRATRVISMVEHPYITSPDEFFPSTLGEFIDSIGSEGYDSLNKYLDGTLGLKSGLFNSWARSTAESNKVGIAGSVNILSFNDTANSLVEAGALINQNKAWRTWATNEHENNEDPALGENDETANEQVVSVEASNYMELLNMTGIFSLDLPSGSLDPTSLEFDPKLAISPAAAEGKKGGVGGALFVMLIDNKTHSTIQDGAKVYSGSDGTFNMKADEAIFNIDLGQAGASAGTVAVGGTVMYTGQKGDTVARLGSGVEVTGREVSVYAASLETNAMWAGGIAKGEAIGAGISVAVNNIDRTTLALIGEKEDKTPGAPADAPGIKVAEDVTLRAIVGGELWAFTVAGAVVSKSPDTPKANAPGSHPTSGGGSDSDPLDGVSLPLLFNEDPAGSATGNSGSAPTDTTQKQKTGIAIAAAAGVNLIKEYTQASVIDAGVDEDRVEGGSLSLTAENRSRIVAVSGGLAFTKQSSGGTAVALAGAFSYNGIDATTNALVEDTDFELDGNGIEWPTDIDNATEVLPTVRISSLANGKIVSAAAGGAGSVASGTSTGSGSGSGGGSTVAVAVAGSVTVNTITSANTAMAKNATFTILSTDSEDDNSTGKVKVTAVDTSSIFAMSGGLSLSIASGKQGSSTAVSAGIAVAVNKITSSTTALLEESTVTWKAYEKNGHLVDSKGDLLVWAKSAETIDAYTIAGAVSAASGTQGSGIAAAGAASGSVNLIDFDTSSTVKNGTVTLGTGGATIKAEDKSKVTSAAGAIGVAVGLGSQGNGGAGAFGAAFSVNNIGSAGAGSFVLADVDDSQITSGGDIAVDAANGATIFSLAVGAAGSVSSSGQGNAISGSLAGSASINQTRTGTQARTRNGSKLKTKAGSTAAIDIEATDDSAINATAGSAALQAATGQNVSAAVGLGLSLTINDIDNTTIAAIEDSTAESDGSVSVVADSSEKIESLAFGIALGVAASSNGTAVAANATGAVSKNNINNITQAIISDSTPNVATPNVKAKGAVLVSAVDESTIKANALAAAASIAVSSSSVSAGVSIGVGVALNTIGNATKAAVNGVGVLAGGGAMVLAESDAQISSLALAASASVGVSGGSATVTIAPAVSYAENDIDNTTEALIKGGSIVTTPGAFSLQAVDNSKIKSDIAAAAVSAAFTGGSAAISFSVAGTIGLNDIANKTRAVVTDGAKVDAGTVSIAALSKSKIETIGVSASVAVSGSGGSVSVSGAGAVAVIDNKITSTVEAIVEKSSKVIAGGPVTISATDSSDIDATVAVAAISAGGSSTVAVNVSIAAAVALNEIGTTVRAAIDKSDVSSTGGNVGMVRLEALSDGSISSEGVAASIAAGGSGTVSVSGALSGAAVTNKMTGKVEAVITNGSKVNASGPMTLSAKDKSNIDTKVVAASIAAGGSGTVAVNLSGAAAVALNEMGTTVRAAIDGSTVSSTAGAAGKITLEALSEGSITAYGVAAGISAGGSGTVSVSGALSAVAVTNKMTGKVEAVITNGSDVDATGLVTLSAEDDSDIDALAVAAAFSASGSGVVAVNISGAAAAALNEYGTATRAAIDGSSVTSAGGDVSLAALSDGSITVNGDSGSVSAGGSGAVTVNGAGAGAGATAKTTNVTEAVITGSTVSAENGSVKLTATDSTAVDVDVIGVAFSGGGGQVEVDVALSAAAALTDVSGIVRSKIEDSTVSASGDVTMASLDNSVVKTKGTGVSVAIGGALWFALEGAGTAAYVSNTVNETVETLIVDSKITAGGAVAASAKDSLDLDAEALAATVSVSGGITSASISVSAAVAENILKGSTIARIDNSVVGAGSVDLDATSSSALEANADAYAVAGSISIGFSGSGSGGEATNTIERTVTGAIESGSKKVTGSTYVTVGAHDKSAADANVTSVAVSAGMSGVATGVGLATSTLDSTTTAYISGSSVEAGAGGILVDADATQDGKASASIAAVTAAIGAAGAGGNANVTVKSDVAAYAHNATLTTTGDLFIDADSKHTAHAKTIGAGAALGFAVSAMISETSIGGETRAFVDGSNTIDVGSKAEISSNSITDALSDGKSVSFGTYVGVATAEIKADVNRVTEAYVGTRPGNVPVVMTLNVGTDNLVIKATSDHKATADDGGGAAGGVAVSVFTVDASIEGSTRAFVGDKATVTAGSVEIAASGKTETTAKVRSVGIGLVEGAYASAVATDTHLVEAFVGPASANAAANPNTPASITTTGNVTIQASMDSSTLAQGDMLGIGLLGAGYAETTATGTPTVLAYLGDRARIAAGGDVNIKAIAEGDAIADGSGTNVDLAGYSGAKVTANLNPTVKAFTKATGSISGNNVTIESRFNLNESGLAIKPTYEGDTVGPAFGTVTLGKGSLIAGVAAGTVNVTNSPTITARVASGTTITATGIFTLKSNAFELAEGDGASVVVGGLAGVGIADVTANAKGTITSTFEGTLTSAANASVRAGADANTDAVGRAGVGSLGGSVADVVINATTSPVVTASVSGTFTATGDIVVRTDVETTAKATATGREISGLASGGTLTANATAQPDIDAVVSGTVTSTAGDILLQAFHNADDVGFDSNNTVYAAVETLNAAIGVSAFESELNAKALADVEARLESKGRLQAASGDVVLATRSGNFSEAALHTDAGAFVDVDTGADPTARAAGNTKTRLLGKVGEGSTAGAQNVTVMAQAVDYALTDNKAASGGAIRVAESVTNAKADPTVKVEVGGTGSVVLASNDITVKALSTNDADSTNKVSGGGALNIDEYEANATANATVDVVIGTDSDGLDTRIEAGKDITISAANNETSDEMLGGSFDGSAVETGNGENGNSITFIADHGLETGDVVTYDSQGPVTFGGLPTAIGGLKDGRQYNVIVLGAKVVQLGATFDGASIDTATDQIVFTTPHNLEDGDMVYYFAPTAGDIGGLASGTRYKVNKIDDFHIKLLDPDHAPSTTTTAASSISGNTISASNSFADGDLVTYHAPSNVAHFTSLCVDAKVESDGLTLKAGRNGVDYYDNDAIIADWDADGTLDAHNLVTGDALVYTASDPTMAIGGLVSGQTYYAIVYSNGQIQLADSLDHALGRQWKEVGGGYEYGDYHIELTAQHDYKYYPEWTRVDHTLTRVQNSTIGGLVDGGTYFVKSRTNTSFQLADASGTVVTLANGLTGSGQKFVVEGIDLTGAGTGSQKLVLDIMSPGFGTQKLEGGSATNFVSSSVDRTTTASASGGGGGAIDVKSGKSNSSATATVKVTVHDATLAAGTVNLLTDAVVLGKATTSTGGGGGIDIGDANAVAKVKATSTIAVESDAVVTATGDILIRSKSNLDGDAVAETDVKGVLGSGVDADSETHINYETKTEIDGKITAAGKLAVEARTLVDGYTRAYTDGSGIGADSDANDTGDRGVFIGDTKAENVVDIKEHAVLTAATVELNAIVDKFKAKADSDADAEAAGTDCDSEASISAKGSTNVMLETGSNIVGTGSVLIQSQYLKVDLVSDAHSDSDAVGGDTDATANVDVHTTAKVTGRDEAIIRTADLDVDSTQSITRYDRKAERDGAWIDAGDTYEQGDADFNRDIFWESRVIMLGDQPSPEVVVDYTGKVETIKGGVTLTDQGGVKTYKEGDTYAAGDDIVVKDLVNHGSPAGTVEFRANALGDLDDENTPHGQIWGNNADFEVQNTWDHVSITNYSAHDLIINDIDPLSEVSGIINVKVDEIFGWTHTPGDNVSLDEDDPGKTFEFELDNNSDRTEVSIKNLQGGNIADSNIILDGIIENPAGITEIVNQRGDIVAGVDTGPELIRSNELHLTATTGAIGRRTGDSLGRAPISIELVKFADTEEVSGLSEVHDMVLTADAAKDVVLDITANDRSQMGTPAPFEVNIERITAGDDADIVINDSKAGVGLAPSGGVEVNLFDPPQVDYPGDLIESTGSGVTSPFPGQAQSGMYFEHFRPDGAGASGNLLRAFGLDSEDVDSTYNFAAVRAGDDIDIGHMSTVGLSGEGEPRSYALTKISLTDRGEKGVSAVIAPDTAPYTTIDFNINTDVAWAGGSLPSEPEGGLDNGVHEIFLTTNGDIAANELAGDMLVGHVHSNSGDVTLSTVNGSILDALGDTVADVCGRSVDIDANGGSIGTVSDDLEIDSLRGWDDTSLNAGGKNVGLEASTGVYLTETHGNLRLVFAHSYAGDIRLTVTETDGDYDESLQLIESGTAFHAESDATQWRTLNHGQIFAEAGSVLLRVGDDVSTHGNSEIVAAHNIDIYGDYGNADEDWGTTMQLRGRIVAGATVTQGGPVGTYVPSTPTPANRTQIWGDTDADRIVFGKTGVANASWGDSGYIFLGSLTMVYGSDGGDTIDARAVTYTGTVYTGMVIFGGAGNDIIYGSQGDDLIFGDNGRVYFGTTEMTDLDQAWSDPYSVDSGIATTGYVATPAGTIYGGNDKIRGEGGSDTIIGGVGTDTLYGDNDTGSHGDYDGRDVVIGDNARITYAGDAYPGSATQGQFYTLGNTPIMGVRSTDSTTTTGGADSIWGNSHVDVLIGGVCDDAITSDDGDVVQNGSCNLMFVVRKMTAEGRAPTAESTEVIDDAGLAPIVEQAKAAWEEALGNDNRLDALEGVKIAITDLSGDTLGVATGNQILIDIDAAGYGWFIDATPDEGSEFLNGRVPSGMDLLTVVEHEMGHLLGYEDVYDDSNTIMDGVLATGVRYAVAGVAQNSPTSTLDGALARVVGTAPDVAHIGITSLAGPGWAFGQNGESMTFRDWLGVAQQATNNAESGATTPEKKHDARLVSLENGTSAGPLGDIAMEPDKLWLSDFLISGATANADPNRDIAITIEPSPLRSAT